MGWNCFFRYAEKDGLIERVYDDPNAAKLSIPGSGGLPILVLWEITQDGFEVAGQMARGEPLYEPIQ